MQSRNVFVAGLPASVDDVVFKEYFSSCGVVLTAKVMLNIHTGISRGFGFILFQTHEEALRAVDTLNGTVLPDSAVPLHVALSKHDAEHLLLRTKKLLVRNIPVSVTEDQLMAHLQQFGVITQICSRLDAQGISLLLEYDSEAAAQSAVHHTHGHLLFPQCTSCVLAKLAEPIVSRRKRLGGSSRPVSPPAEFNGEEWAASQKMPEVYDSCGAYSSYQRQYVPDHQDYCPQPTCYTHTPYTPFWCDGFAQSPIEGSAAVLRAF